jgi:hypothetical protein
MFVISMNISTSKSETALVFCFTSELDPGRITSLEEPPAA